MTTLNNGAASIHPMVYPQQSLQTMIAQITR